MSRLDTKWAR